MPPVKQGVPDHGRRSGSPARGPRRQRLAAAAALVLLTLAAFAPVRHNGFVGADDETYLTGNAAVLEGLTPAGLRLALTRSYAGNWHPLTWASHMLDVELFGLDPRGHHLVSLALHAAAAALLFAVLCRMTGRAGAALAVAALFAVHPLRVESVAWVAERKDVLCGLLWMVDARRLPALRPPALPVPVARGRGEPSRSPWPRSPWR